MVLGIQNHILEEVGHLLGGDALHGALVVGVDVHAIRVVTVEHGEPVTVGGGIHVGLFEKDLLHLVQVFLVGTLHGGVHALREFRNGSHGLLGIELCRPFDGDEGDGAVGIDF